ncbi:PAS domain-containing protein [Rariglobus hedericola]|uniref:PAS domain-containing protein n=1 Tax=Rariglobus hedericola TaxID=2597822 RepID=A0A556QM84_9BACT|nr:PAS domain-containing protein [Rariglobus hedericola]TSJ77737.1 hypothetical protein FPL22_00050 [Rariglobus hedericola]
MNTLSLQPTPFIATINQSEAAALLRRLVTNLRGFAYRRRYDRTWTMEWVSDAFHRVTGYEAHRVIKNQSLSFAHLIHPEDLPGVAAQIQSALMARRRTTVTYRIMAAHHAAVTVEDRLVGVYDASGAIIAIEGVIDHAQI